MKTNTKVSRRENLARIAAVITFIAPAGLFGVMYLYPYQAAAICMLAALCLLVGTILVGVPWIVYIIVKGE